MSWSEADVEELDALVTKLRADYKLVSESDRDFNLLLGTGCGVDRPSQTLVMLVNEAYDAGDRIVKNANLVSEKLSSMGWR